MTHLILGRSDGFVVTQYHSYRPVRLYLIVLVLLNCFANPSIGHGKCSAIGKWGGLCLTYVGYIHVVGFGVIQMRVLNKLTVDSTYADKCY